MKSNNTKKILGAVLSSMLFLSIYIGMMFSFIYLGLYEDSGIPKLYVIFIMIILSIVCISMIVNLINRIKEIVGGEEDEASKY